jgi:hypothetical protein
MRLTRRVRGRCRTGFLPTDRWRCILPSSWLAPSARNAINSSRAARLLRFLPALYHEPRQVSAKDQHRTSVVDDRQPLFDPVFADRVLVQTEQPRDLLHRVNPVDLHRPGIGMAVAILSPAVAQSGFGRPRLACEVSRANTRRGLPYDKQLAARACSRQGHSRSAAPSPGCLESAQGPLPARWRSV